MFNCSFLAIIQETLILYDKVYDEGGTTKSWGRKLLSI